jgi:hypothetical protein
MNKLLLYCFGLLLVAGCATSPKHLNHLTPAEQEAGWVLLFDGTSLTGWTPRDSARWDVVEGAITYRPGTGPGFLCTTATYDNFELQVEFWVDDVANSGVFLRCPATGPIAGTNAYEVNIFDAHDKWPTGSINEIVVRQGDTRSVGRWNRYDILAQGDHLVVRFEGRVVVDVRDQQHVRGPIALQQFKGEGMVKFRNIKLRRL